MPRDYLDAKRRIINALDGLTQDIAAGKELFLDERIICVRLEPKFEAKSYMPSTLINEMSSGSSRIVGGRKYTILDDESGASAKLYFIRTTDSGINQLKTTLQNGNRDNVGQWQQEIRSIHTINLLEPNEKIMGFSDSWRSGTVEFVLHPLPSSTENEIAEFFKYSDIKISNARIKTYSDGITFISAFCTNENIQRIKRYNPLRAIHPMGSISITPIRNVVGSHCPAVYPSSFRPNINIGVFDGGADASLPLLNGYVTEIDGSSDLLYPN